MHPTTPSYGKELPLHSRSCSPAVTQPKCPVDHRKQAQMFTLVCLCCPFRIMPKRPPTSAAAIPIHPYIPAACISRRLLHPPPALEGLPFTISTLPRTFFSPPLDNRQLQDNNRHDGLIDVMFLANTILQAASPFFNKTHRLCYTLPRYDFLKVHFMSH